MPGGAEINGPDLVPTWIANGLDQQAIEYAEIFGKELTGKEDNNSSYRKSGDALTTSQIRNVFGEVKKIQMKGFVFSDFLLLKPRLKYSVARKQTEGSKDFGDVIGRAIDTVIKGRDINEQKARFDNFVAFFEAILAYHRAYGGK
jgi:CRISPR-associated protein Csm2